MAEKYPKNSEQFLIQRSGFPLQIWAEHIVNTELREKWLVFGSERRWRVPPRHLIAEVVWDRPGHSGGYIDLLLARQLENSPHNFYLNIEFKKSIEDRGPWVFFVEQTEEPESDEFKVLFSYQSKAGEDMSGSHGRYSTIAYEMRKQVPASYISDFAVLSRGAGSESIDSIASHLNISTEAIAVHNVLKFQKEVSSLLYCNVVVTNQDIRVFKYDADSFDPSLGEFIGMDEDDRYESVPWIHYQKQIDSNVNQTIKIPESVPTLHAIDRNAERSTYVVAASALCDFLKRFSSERM